MTTESDKTKIEAVLEAVNRAYHERDAGGVVAHFTPDAHISDLAPPLSHRIDKDGIAAWLGTWEGPVDRETRDLHITAAGDLAFGHAYVKVSAVTKQGGHHAAWWMRATWCLHREHGAWKITHEHTSVPFLMDGSFRAAVDLTP